MEWRSLLWIQAATNPQNEKIKRHGHAKTWKRESKKSDSFETRLSNPYVCCPFQNAIPTPGDFVVASLLEDSISSHWKICPQKKLYFLIDELIDCATWWRLFGRPLKCLWSVLSGSFHDQPTNPLHTTTQCSFTPPAVRWWKYKYTKTQTQALIFPQKW